MNKTIISDDQMEGLKNAWKQVVYYFVGIKQMHQEQIKAMEEKQTWKTKYKLTIVTLK